MRVGPPSGRRRAHAGIFAEWNWDGHELVVRNDRHGMQPLFYYTGSAEIGVAPMLWTLLEQGAPRELDEEALAVFFRVGFFLREDTPFRSIKAVPPKATFRWNRSGLTLHSEPPIAASPLTIDRDRALQMYQELFSRAVRRRLPARPFACLLSGGRDSRHILFELMCQGHKADLAATVAVPTNTDAEVSARIAKELRLPHLLVPATRQCIASEQRRNKETHFCADEHGWIFELSEALRGRVNLLYDGLGGDVLSAGLFLNSENLTLMRQARFLELAGRLIAEENVEPFVIKALGEEENCSLGEIARRGLPRNWRCTPARRIRSAPFSFGTARGAKLPSVRSASFVGSTFTFLSSTMNCLIFSRACPPSTFWTTPFTTRPSAQLSPLGPYALCDQARSALLAAAHALRLADSPLAARHPSDSP